MLKKIMLLSVCAIFFAITAGAYEASTERKAMAKSVKAMKVEGSVCRTSTGLPGKMQKFENGTKCLGEGERQMKEGEKCVLPQNVNTGIRNKTGSWQKAATGAGLKCLPVQ
ncbi:MAG: hypothetical protein A2583_07505 [Bdellovibrionales bacterium RIFOXYD1_FULL_53_11]|nr:MAG: hypothetical protein A2583_07505 [Bdellovibrionales bacterium RIFOXYD1_FULL_53_11]